MTLPVGIAFSGKATMAAYSLYDLVAQQGEVVALTDPYSQEEDVW